MSIILFSNNASTTIASPISAGATSVSVAPGTGGQFPSPGANQYAVATFNGSDTGQINEIVRITARSGDTMTIVRGQEGTAARSWNAGDTFISYFTAGSAAAMLQQGQYQQQAANYAVDIGSTNAIIVTLDPAPTALSALVGAPIRVKIAHTTTSGVVTLQCNGLSAPFVKSPALANLAVGTLTVGMIAEFFYDGTVFQYTGPVASSGGGGVSSVTPGIGLLGGGTGAVMLAINPASTAQVQAGIDGAQPITSAALAGAMASSIGSTGYQKLPSGIILQWGRTFAPTGNGDSISLPAPFPHDCTVSSNGGDLGTGDPLVVNININTGPPFTHFTVWTRKILASGGYAISAGAGFGWVAIGY